MRVFIERITGDFFAIDIEVSHGKTVNDTLEQAKQIVQDDPTTYQLGNQTVDYLVTGFSFK